MLNAGAVSNVIVKFDKPPASLRESSSGICKVENPLEGVLISGCHEVIHFKVRAEK